MDDYNQGVETDLKVLSVAHRYHDWLWDKASPFVGRRVFEIGSGIGNYSDFLLDREHVILSDYDHRYVELLRQRLGDRPNVEVLEVDANRITDDQIEHLSAQRIDTVLSLNVLEHIGDDEACVRAMAACLTAPGRLVLIAPAHRALFSALDREYAHCRRYMRADAGRLAAAAGLTVERCEHFNLAGAAGWLVNHSWMKKTRLPPGQTFLFDTLVPLFKLMDLFALGRVGLSLLMVLKKG